MAPAGYVFDKAGWPKSTCRCGSYRPTADEILTHPWNAERIAQMLPSRPSYQLIEGAGHYIFLPPARPLLASRIPDLQRPEGPRPRRHSRAPQRRDDRLCRRALPRQLTRAA